MKYPVEITETLQRIVEIEAASRAEAEEIAEAEWNKEKYVLEQLSTPENRKRIRSRFC